MSKSRIVVNVSDAKVSNDPVGVIMTHSLGSCIAVSLYAPATHIGGMLHYQLPQSKNDSQRAKEKPFMYADTGMNILVDKLVSMGANKKRMQIKIAGEAAMDTGPKGFDIGKRNHLAIRKFLWSKGMFIDSEDVGGSAPRNMYLNLVNEAVAVKSGGIEKKL